LAVTRLDEWRHLLRVRLKLLIAEESRPVTFKGREIGQCHFQDQRVERACNIGKYAAGIFDAGHYSLFNGPRLLHECDCFTGLSKLQPEHVADDDHDGSSFLAKLLAERYPDRGGRGKI